MNYKQNNLLKAKQQFIKDLQQDVDFLQYKSNAKYDTYFSYGILVAGVGNYIMSHYGPSCERLISHYLKGMSPKNRRKRV